MKSSMVITLAVLVAFFLIGLAESEGKSYWQVRFENARYSSSGYHTGAQRYWCERRGCERGYRHYHPGLSPRSHPRYHNQAIPWYYYRNRPRYRGYYGGPWRYYREYPYYR